MFLLGVGALKLGLLLWSTENSVRSSIGGGVRWEWGGRAEYEGSITDCGEGVSQSGAPGVEAGLSLAAGLSEVDFCSGARGACARAHACASLHSPVIAESGASVEVAPAPRDTTQTLALRSSALI